MWDLFRSAFEFIVFTVIIKIIVGRWLAEQIMKYSQRWFAQTERNWAIWTHYQNRALGNGHPAHSVLDCGQDKCAVF